MSVDYSKITHNLNPGDRVRVKGYKKVACVVEITPMQHWENCVELDNPLSGYKFWDANELEKVSEVSQRR